MSLIDLPITIKLWSLIALGVFLSRLVAWMDWRGGIQAATTAMRTATEGL